MNLRDLEYVTSIDRYRNFGKAAEACNVSQPALSAQVKKLEQRLGVELFSRSSSGVITTDAGVRIVATAKDVLRSARLITDTAAEYHDPLSAPLRIGLIPTLAPFITPYLSHTIKGMSEDLKRIYREQPRSVLLHELGNRLIDVALVNGPVAIEGYNFTPVFREPLLLAVAKSHRLANMESIVPSAIPVEQLMLLSDEHCPQSAALSLFSEKNLGIDVADNLLATNLLTLSHYVAEDAGCTLVTKLAQPFLERSNHEIRLIPIDDADFAREIGFVSRKGCPRTHILLALCDQIRANLPPDVTPAN